ncbi:MAG: hypothetical protein IJT71_02440 [Oscillospiraceae bacterium]|nr:hypothetical protein [Oscillospiraceae bacterium]
MNENILCVVYSRTGRTKRLMEDISAALDCELAEISDRVERQGTLGWLRCGMDAMRKRTRPINRLHTRRALADYDLVILGTPVWAGRCSSVMRAFLKRRGYELRDVAYVITHASEEPYRAVFEQMDKYLQTPHVEDVSLCPGSAGYIFWRDLFLKTVAGRMNVELRPIPEPEDEDGESGENGEAAASEPPETEQ